MTQGRLRLEIQGVVQGVGFRPFVYLLAQETGLSGWVCNSAAGASIEVEGENGALQKFLDRLRESPPPHARLRSLETISLPPRGDERFEIRESRAGPKRSPVLPDLSVCTRCLEEMFDPKNRRYLYPFTNCAHCGPRFSIVEALPYDRTNTTMRAFAMCEACRVEYEDPGNRRFHAQPIACPACGPRLEFWDTGGDSLATGHPALLRAAVALRAGEIVAMKGVGGFHLLVDARNDSAVARLRRRKAREAKPFALLFPSLDSIQGVAELTELEASLLVSPEAPIVLVPKKTSASPWRLAASVAPDNPTLGAMLPSNPLQHLLMSELGFPLVATSGNRSEEPICIEEREALSRLQGIADAFLVHDRPIARPVDDSVLRVVAGRELMLRRARGFAPLPIDHSDAVSPCLAFGAHLKNTVALALEGQIFVSQHVGDLHGPQARAAFAEISEGLRKFYGVEEYQAVCDLHPDYASTDFARQCGRPVRHVQHHHAHIVSCMAEQGVEGKVLGVAWDGSGYGEDGNLWGGEFLLATRSEFTRFGHFLEFGLPGGEAAIREPRRAALGLLYELFGAALFAEPTPPLRESFTDLEWKLLSDMLVKNVATPRTSSVGRLFDGTAALLGLRAKTSFEGEAAMQLEFLAAESDHEEAYPVELCHGAASLVVDWRPMLSGLLEDLRENRPKSFAALRFHNTLAETVVELARRAGENRVVLSGGCFQNRLLAEKSIARLQAEGFQPLWHWRIPPNDGGISLGQAAVAASRSRS